MSQIKCHTHLHLNSRGFREQEEEQNITEMQFAILQIHFLSISSPSNLYCLMSL